ncbi:MAG: DUF2029 domain-containing protein [Planctomycetes bacterium]|nr:DUF2029 domain-containing protein [Planctomycetota bacterium]
MPPDTSARTPWWATPLVARLSYVACLAMIGWGAYATWRVMDSVDPPSRRFRDFYEFYSGAEALVHGKDVFSAGDLGYIYPPLLAVLLMPLVKLGISGAGAVWLAINVAMLAFTVWLGGRTAAGKLGIPKAAPLVGLIGFAIVADKVLGDMKMQQSNILLLGCWIIAMWGLGRHWLISGLALGFGVSIKYLPIVALAYFGIRGRARHFVGFVVGIILWALIPAAFIGWQANAALWRGATGGLVSAGETDGPTAGEARVMSTRGFGISITTTLIRLGDSRGLPLLGPLMAAGLMGAIFLLVWWIYRRHGQSMFVGRFGKSEADRWPLLLVEWTGLIVMALAFSPQTNARHLSQAMPLGFLIGAVALGAPTAAARRLAAIAGLVLFLGFALPPSIPSLQGLVTAWRMNAGSCSCMVLAWLLVVEAVLRGWDQTRKIEPSFLPRSTDAENSVTVSSAMPQTPIALAI